MNFLAESHMHVLYLVPYTPTPIRTRPYNLIRALARRGHRVTLATLWQDEAERAALEQLEREGIRIIAARLTRGRVLWNLLRGLPTGEPLQAHYCWNPALAEAVVSRPSSEGSDGPFDVVHVEHLRGARYGLAFRPQPPASLDWPGGQPGQASLQPPIIWDAVDCISYLFEQAARESRSRLGRWMARLELPRTRRYEGWLAHQFARVLVTSEVDRQALQDLASRSMFHVSRFTHHATRNTQPVSYPVPLATCDLRPVAITVLPNGVDLAYFCPDDTPRDEATVLFTGKMSYHANVTAALHLVHDIMPLVWAQRPDVKVIIAGKDPPPAIRNLPSAVRNLQVTGAVPDLRPYLRRATIAAVPTLYGAGIQNKALEALACAAAVVASPPAVAALAVRPGQELIVAGDAGAFARAILELLDDPARRAALGRAGRAYVEQHHDWNRIADELAAIYADAVRGHQT